MTMVVAERVLVEVGLQILPAHAVVDAVNPKLDRAPEPLDAVGMHVASHVLAFGMRDRLVAVPFPRERAIDAALVGVDLREFGSSPKSVRKIKL